MTSAYLDANYLIKLQCAESGSTAVQTLARTFEVLFCSLHGRIEFVSACHRKIREGQATLLDLQALLAQLHADSAAGALQWLPVTEAVLVRAESVYRTAPPTTYLRAADVLHLDSAAEHGFAEIYSNDRHLLAAAPLFGLQGLNVIP